MFGNINVNSPVWRIMNFLRGFLVESKAQQRTSFFNGKIRIQIQFVA
jgi:hypothetical protein